MILRLAANAHAANAPGGKARAADIRASKGKQQLPSPMRGTHAVRSQLRQQCHAPHYAQACDHYYDASTYITCNVYTLGYYIISTYLYIPFVYYDLRAALHVLFLIGGYCSLLTSNRILTCSFPIPPRFHPAKHSPVQPACCSGHLQE